MKFWKSPSLHLWYFTGIRPRDEFLLFLWKCNRYIAYHPLKLRISEDRRCRRWLMKATTGEKSAALRAFVESAMAPGFFSCLAADHFKEFRSKTQGNLFQIDIHWEILCLNNSRDKFRLVETFFRDCICGRIVGNSKSVILFVLHNFICQLLS